MSNGTVTLIGFSRIAFVIPRQVIFPVERKRQESDQTWLDNKPAKGLAEGSGSIVHNHRQITGFGRDGRQRTLVFIGLTSAFLVRTREMDLSGQMRSYKTDVGVRRSMGISLLDLMVTLVIGSLLFTLSVPAYNGFVNRGRVARAIGEIAAFDIEIERFRLANNDRIPVNLAELPIEIPSDPWGRAYQFLNIVTAGPGKGAFRKDGKLNPLNTDYDLYSMGADGDSKGPLSAKASRDDIVRASNGAFIGLGEDY
jgi:general secretion pathway protein G